MNKSFSEKIIPMRYFKIDKKIAFAAIYFIAVLLICLFITSCAEKTAEDDSAEHKVPVETVIIETGLVEDFLDTFGIFESFATVELAAEQDGRVVEITAKEGDFLKAGQTILKMDDSIYRAEKERDEVHLNQMRSVFNRNQQLYASKSISEKDYEESMFDYQRAEAAYAISRTRLERCEIRSPIDAHLDEIFVESGEYLVPGKAVARLEKTDRLKLVFFIPEKDVNALKEGTEVEYCLDFIPGEIFKGKIAFLSRAASRDSLSFKAEIHIENSDGRFRPGMIAKVRVVRNLIKDAIAVPITAIVPRYGGHYVFVVKDGRAYQREVKIALLSGDKAVLSGGLKPGEIMVISGSRLLREKDQVEIVGKEE